MYTKSIDEEEWEVICPSTGLIQTVSMPYEMMTINPNAKVGVRSSERILKHELSQSDN